MSVHPPRPRLLNETTFRRFWLGQSISMLGDQVTLFALPLIAVLVLHADAAQMGYLTALGMLPSLLFSLHAGVWVDRRGKRRQIMLLADVVRAGLLLTLPVAFVLGRLTLLHLYGVAFLVGVFDVLFSVAYNTLFVSIVAPEAYLEGNALTNGSRAFSSVVGQGMAGILVALLSAPGALVADALSFGVSALALRSIQPQEPPPAPAQKGQLGTGLRFILRSPVMRAALGATATVNFFNFVFVAIFTLYAVRTLDVQPALLGAVLSAGAIGGLVGTAVTRPVSRRLGVGRAFVLSCVLFPAPLLFVPLASGHGTPRLILLFLAEFGSGLGVMLLDISIGTIFAQIIPDAIRATVSGAYRMINYGMRPLGAMLGGFLAAEIGIRQTLWVATLGGTLCVLWGVFSPLIHKEWNSSQASHEGAAPPLGKQGT